MQLRHGFGFQLLGMNKLSLISEILMEWNMGSEK